MYDIYATDMEEEQCAADKEKINMVIPYAVIHFVLSGEGYINGKRITENTVFISFENNRMNYYPSKEDPWHYIYLRLRGNDLEKVFSDHGFGKGITIRHFEDVQKLLHILALYRDIKDMNDTDARKIIANSVFLLFGKQIFEPKSKSVQHAEQIKDHIDKYYYKRITVEEIAGKFYLNKNYLRTVFVNHIGVSPKQYLQKVRMERSAFLLTTTNEDISLIANSVGYEDPLLFSKMFKRYYGISPSEYRRKTGKKQE